jgi:translocation and assembly module TamB
VSARLDQDAATREDARIADLRARRRARMRWLALRGAVLAGALVLLLGLGVGWLLNSVGGRDLLLAQIVARLPADATLTWARADGPASGPMTLHGLRFAWKGTVFRADEVVLDPAVRPLLSRTLRLDALRVRGAVLSIPRDKEPFRLPEWPGSLPAIAPPIALRADHVEVDRLRVDYAGTPVLAVARLRTGLDVSAGALHVERLVMEADRGRFTLHGDYRPRDDFRTDLRAAA